MSCSWFFFFFFFKQNTAYEMRISDWSSDVCSSDLALLIAVEMIPDLVRTVGNVTMDVAATTAIARMGPASDAVSEAADGYGGGEDDARSEERRVGKECVSMCSSR